MNEGSGGRARKASTSRLPAERAFVLQLRPETDAGAGSDVLDAPDEQIGAAEQFVSAADLIRFVRRVLGSGPAERVASEEER